MNKNCLFQVMFKDENLADLNGIEPDDPVNVYGVLDAKEGPMFLLFNPDKQDFFWQWADLFVPYDFGN